MRQRRAPAHIRRWVRTTPPTVNDDAAHGFRKGDVIVDTAAKIAWICWNNANGAAFWAPEDLAHRTVSVWRAGTQVLPANALTAIGWGSEYDILGAYDPNPAGGLWFRITVPPGYSAIRITAQLGINLVVSETERYNEAYLYKNGSYVPNVNPGYGGGLASIYSHAGGTGSDGFSTRRFPVVAGDYFELFYKNLDLTQDDWLNANFSHMIAEFWP